MPTPSPLKRPSGGGGRLRRLLASLRPPARAGGPLPVQTGFPTSLADIVVKNHGRLRNPRRRHRAPGATVPPPAAAAAEPAPIVAQWQQRRELSVADQDAAARAPAPVTAARPGRGSCGFSIRPGLLAAGGAVALALLVVWSKQLVAAATIASVALSLIENASTARPRRPETQDQVDSPRGCVSPIREAADSGSGGIDAGADSGELDCDDDDDDTSASVSCMKRKQSRRSLRKLLAGKLRNGKTPRGKDSRYDGEACEHEQPGVGESNAEPAAASAGAGAESIADDERWHRRRDGALSLPALVPIILAGLVAGKIPALALAVLCAAFSSSSVEKVPVPAEQRGSSR